MKKLGLIIFLIVIVIIGTIYSNNRKINLYDQEYLKPYLFSFGVDEDRYKKIVNKKYIDPLGVSVTAVSYFYYGKINNDTSLIEKGLNIVNILKNYPYKRTLGDSTVYMYEQTHGKWKAKTWWSGMSNGSISLAYMMAYDITKKEEYRELSLYALRGVTNEVKNNGSRLVLDKESYWYKEYVNDSTNIENAQFVLNGFTFSLIAINSIGNYLNDKEILNYYKKGLNGFLKFSDRFYDNKGWLYYMLNPKTTESMHYGVFDLLLLKSLYYKENKNVLLEKEILKRENIFKKHFGLEQNKEGLIYLSTIGIPYPYWVDIYPGKIIVNYKDGSNKKIKFAPLSNTKTNYERLYYNVACCNINNIKNIEVYQKKNSIEFLLFEVEPKELIISDNNELIMNNIKDEYIMNNSGKIIDKLNYEILHKSELRVRLLLEEKLKLNDDKLFLINYESSQKLKNIQIVLIDNKGKAVSSYYPIADELKSNIVLSPVGFTNYDSLDSIKEIRLYVSPDKKAELTRFKINQVLFNLNKKQLSELILSEDILKNTFHIQFKD
ncbi:D-glucuronyl C5-epimerase family protein [Malaciobacter canalis]|uniref:D-glucuronyl C5-epimerase family protein n=1 Tax=Malaciobacter canalis TaxID=1912871 RepID=UPI00384ED6EA